MIKAKTNLAPLLDACEIPYPVTQIHMLCLIGFSVPCWVFVPASFLQNNKSKNPGRIMCNAPRM